ncbi:hypothetical protein PG987_005129 [Apiospora arundinis]
MQYPAENEGIPKSGAIWRSCFDVLTFPQDKYANDCEEEEEVLHNTFRTVSIDASKSACWKNMEASTEFIIMAILHKVGQGLVDSMNAARAIVMGVFQTPAVDRRAGWQPHRE